MQPACRTCLHRERASAPKFCRPPGRRRCRHVRRPAPSQQRHTSDVQRAQSKQTMQWYPCVLAHWTARCRFSPLLPFLLSALCCPCRRPHYQPSKGFCCLVLSSLLSFPVVNSTSLTLL